MQASFVRYFLKIKIKNKNKPTYNTCVIKESMFYDIPLQTSQLKVRLRQSLLNLRREERS